MEATYVGGSGVLIGAGHLWVLLTDPGDEDVVHEIWQLVSRPAGPAGSGPSIAEQVLAVVERSFDGDPPGLALVDFSTGGSTSLSRGSGHVRLAGPGRVLTLDSEADTADARGRRLIGGVVPAGQVELRPLSAPTRLPAQEAADEAPAPAAGGVLIDGIPESILAASGPDGPPLNPRPRRTPHNPSPHTTEAADTGALNDTVDPGPDGAKRIEEGGHTTIRPAVGEPAPADDHDGATVHRPSHMDQSSVPTVLAVSCPLGHLGPPTAPACRVCHQRIAPQEPRRVPRPTLGGLRLPTSEVVPLDRGVVLGRKPAPPEGSSDWPHLVHLPSDHSFVSRRHLQIELDGWDVIARDLDSRGGTTLTVPGREPERMLAGQPYVLAPGTVLDLAEVYAVRFETGAVAGR